MKLELVGDKRVLQRTAEEKMPFVQRLRRIEGQVRGIRQMIEDDRYCGDALQQTSAVIAAIREVGLLLVSQQLHAQIEGLVDTPAGSGGIGRDGQGIPEFVDMLRSTYRI